MDLWLSAVAFTRLMSSTKLILLHLLLLLSLLSEASAKIDNALNTDITELLNSLLKGYNKHLRPGFGGPPLEVVTNILIRSMGPVSEEQMMFSMDCYFRQQWTDARLAFEPRRNITELRPSIKMLELIWKPDTFFLNGQSSYLHTITYANKLFRIKSMGDILYSQRLTIKSSCPMFLHKYPLDSQNCPLYLGSYGYGPDDIEIKWKEGPNPPVKAYSDVQMAQFKLVGITFGNTTTTQNHGGRSILHVEFEMTREIGYYLLQIYLPCYLIVIISWVSFWINREATPARVTLGITTLLTTCTIAITGRTGIPKVSYSTALDIFLLMCFTYVFAALVEYAGVNYFTKTAVIEKPEDDDDVVDTENFPSCSYNYHPKPTKENETNRPLLRPNNYATTSRRTVTTDINGHTILNSSEVRVKDSCWTMLIHCLQGDANYRTFKSMTKSGTLSVSKIDSLARIIFPFSFLCLNVLYWAGFMYYF